MLVAMLGSNCLSLSGQIKNSKKFGFLVCTGEREAVCWVKEELSRKKNMKKTHLLPFFVCFNSFIWSSFYPTRKQNPVSALKQKFQVESLKTCLKILSLEATSLFHDYVKKHENIL